jgi:decaprenylphospho-beta-D-ribofuranose 2-oxidase
MQVLTGWGNTAPSNALVVAPAFGHEADRAFDDVADRGVIARGLGRSYGDPAQNAGGRVILTTGMGRVELDPSTGVVTADAGTSLDDLLRLLVPRGWFVPVTPGTRFVTLGGMLAADVHGKNHHRSGSFSHHVDMLTLQTPDASERPVSPDDDPEAFWATVGGMGLTGLIRSITFRAKPIESSRVLVDTDRARDLDDAMARMAEADHHYDYSVAWIDLMATGASMGRSVLTSGRFARVEELPTALVDHPLDYRAGVIVSAPPLVPSGLLNRLSIRAFNELWFRKAPRHRRDQLQTIPSFFHPLDMIGSWNRIYGSVGFLQWQCLVPFGEESTLHTIVERLSAGGWGSFLAVLKRFGGQGDGMLSFPAPGWTLTLDLAAADPALGTLLDELDRMVVEVGGRIYLAKDSRMDAALLPTMYPRLDEFRAVQARLDPRGLLRSDLARRLSIL